MVTRQAFSSGGVIFRAGDRGPEVALIAREEGRVWCLPKGTIEHGESLEETARREVAEETGLKGEILQKIDEIEYWFRLRPDNIRCHKRVHFFLMSFIAGELAKDDREVFDSRWFPIDEALAVLTYKSERTVLKKARHLIAGKFSTDG